MTSARIFTCMRSQRPRVGPVLIDEKNALLLAFTRQQSWQVYTELIRQMLSKILEKLV